MSLIGRIRNRIRAGAARSRLEREMQEEMREHLAQAADRFRARGMSERDALAAARREFGNVGVMQEEARDARGARWIESAIGDLRHASRQFARTPLLAATIVLVLTLGIGVSSAGFSIIAGILTRPAPGVPADERLVAIRGINLTDGRYQRAMSYPELIENARLPEFTEVAGFTTSMVVVELQGELAGTAIVQFVTPNYFRTLGVTVRPGRAFVQSRVDANGEPEFSAVISQRYAIEAFGTPESAVGRTMRLNGAIVTIVGVAPPRFLSATGSSEARTLWVPVSAWPVIDRLPADAFTRWSNGSFTLLARLADGVTAERATQSVKVVAARAAAAQPAAPAQGRTVRPRMFESDVVPLRGDISLTGADSRQTVTMISVLVVLILLVCTTTVSSLLVGTALTRRHEIAVRLALGASRARIIRQLLTESSLLALVAGGAGLLLFAGVTRVLRTTVDDVNIDPTWSTALATALFALVTAALCGLSPALHATRDAVGGVLKESTVNATVKSRLQRLFVIAQTALTQPLLVGLAMTITALAHEAGPREAARLGERIVRAEFDTWSAASRRDNRMPAIISRISALPGVTSVIPQSGGYALWKLQAPTTQGGAGAKFRIRTHQAPPGYFETMAVPIVRGRGFIREDSLAPITPIVIGADFARQAFGEQDPIGKRFTALSWEKESRVGEVEVVGVVAVEDVGNSQMGLQLRVFTPMTSSLATGGDADALLIRTEQPAAPLIRTFQEIARAEAPMLPVRTMKTLADIDRENRSEIIEATGAAAAGGLIALLLASVGLYAVVALSVNQRRREIGVRVSLGATPRQVVAMFFRNGLRVSLTGLLIGLPLGVGAMKILASQGGIPQTNTPVIAASVALAVVVVASLASWIPARRAAGVDPLVALRDG